MTNTRNFMPTLPSVDLESIIIKRISAIRAQYQTHQHIVEIFEKFTRLIQGFPPAAADFKTNNSLLEKNYFEWNKKDYEKRFWKIPAVKVDRILLIVSCDKETEKPINFFLDIFSRDDKGKRKKEIFKLTSDQAELVINFIKQVNGYEWHLFYFLNLQISKLNWKNLDNIYVASVHKNYQKIREQMLKMLSVETLNLLQKNIEIGEPLQINLIDAGCGKAPQLLLAAYRLIVELNQKYYPMVKTTIKGCGYDFEEINSDWCREISANEPECKGLNPAIIFAQADSHYIEHMLQQEGKQIKDKPNQLVQRSSDLTEADAIPHLFPADQNTHTFFFSSGSITRMTLGTSFNALKVLHGCWRSSVSQMILGGQTHFLFARRMLKNTGYRIKDYIIMGEKFENTILIERLSEKMMIENIINKIKQQEEKELIHLNLSMNPILQIVLDRVISEIGNLKNRIVSINLSFSYIENMEALAASLKDLPSLTEIYYTCHNTDLLCDFLLHIPTHIKLHIRYTKNEYVLGRSKNLLLRMNYENEWENDPLFYKLISQMGCLLHTSKLPRKMTVDIYSKILKTTNGEGIENIFFEYVRKAQNDLVLQESLMSLISILILTSIKEQPDSTPQILMYPGSLQQLIYFNMLDNPLLYETISKALIKCMPTISTLDDILVTWNLNAAQRTQILIAIKDHLPNILNTGARLQRIFCLSELNDEQRQIIWTVLKPNLSKMFPDSYDLMSLFTLPIEQFSEKFREELLNTLTEILGKIITTAEELTRLFWLPLEQLNAKHRTQILTALKAYLPKIFQNGEELVNFFNLGLEELNSTQRALIWATGQHCLSVINVDQFRELFRLTFDELNEEQRTQIWAAIPTEMSYKLAVNQGTAVFSYEFSELKLELKMQFIRQMAITSCDKYEKIIAQSTFSQAKSLVIQKIKDAFLTAESVDVIKNLLIQHQSMIISQYQSGTFTFNPGVMLLKELELFVEKLQILQPCKKDQVFVQMAASYNYPHVE